MVVVYDGSLRDRLQILPCLQALERKQASAWWGPSYRVLLWQDSQVDSAVTSDTAEPFPSERHIEVWYSLGPGRAERLSEEAKREIQ